LVPAREIKSFEPAVTALLYGLATWRHSVPWYTDMKRWEIISEQQGHIDFLLTKKSDRICSSNLLIAQNSVILDKLTVTVLGFRHGTLEIFSLLECVVDLCPTFRAENLLLSSSTVNSTQNYVAPIIRGRYIVLKSPTAIIH
jgi:hypothetical protein